MWFWPDGEKKKKQTTTGSLRAAAENINSSPKKLKPAKKQKGKIEAFQVQRRLLWACWRLALFWKGELEAVVVYREGEVVGGGVGRGRWGLQPNLNKTSRECNTPTHQRITEQLEPAVSSAAELQEPPRSKIDCGDEAEWKYLIIINKCSYLLWLKEGRCSWTIKFLCQIDSFLSPCEPEGGATSCTNPELLINTMLKLCTLIGWFNRCQVCWQCFFPP